MAIIVIGNAAATPLRDYTRFFAVLWFVGGALILAVARHRLRVTRERRERACPRCGFGVPRGTMECGACGFDFWTVGQQP